ncbi:hypothetical protein FRB96_000467 [Tulasnella sp. 330]|nr:hypothetical protein FRB96_000467 [Tulasnella sp. 330]
MFIGAVLATFIGSITLIVEAAPIPPSSQLNAWGATCWGFGGYLCTAYVTQRDGHGFIEYVSRNNNGESWTTTGTPIQDRRVTIQSTVPILAVNTHDLANSATGKQGTTAIFFVAADNTLRFFTDRDNVGWKLDPQSIPAPGLKFMTAASRVNSDGAYTSIFWNDYNGDVHVWRSDYQGTMHDDGTIANFKSYGTFTASITGPISGPVVRDIYTDGGQHWQATTSQIQTAAETDNTAGSWAKQSDFHDDTADLEGASGVTLPWNQGTQKFYCKARPSLILAQSTLSGSSFQPGDKVLAGVPLVGVPVDIVATAVQVSGNGGNYLNIFAMFQSSRGYGQVQSYVSTDEGSTWSSPVSVMVFDRWS